MHLHPIAISSMFTNILNLLKDLTVLIHHLIWYGIFCLFSEGTYLERVVDIGWNSILAVVFLFLFDAENRTAIYFYYIEILDLKLLVCLFLNQFFDVDAGKKIRGDCFGFIFSLSGHWYIDYTIFYYYF